MNFFFICLFIISSTLDTLCSSQFVCNTLLLFFPMKIGLVFPNMLVLQKKIGEHFLGRELAFFVSTLNVFIYYFSVTCLLKRQCLYLSVKK